MTGNGTNKNRHILLCNCKGERISSDLLSSLESYLRKMPVTVTKVNDLCGTLQEKNEQIQNLFKRRSEYLILGCYKRSMGLLLDQSSALSAYTHVNLIESEKEDILSSISDFCAGTDMTPSFEEISQDSDWPSWYPVIDYTRCTSCGQCADFCLFGVYEKTADKVKVINPESCKNNCPACARICPSTAIIFPKYKYGGAIGGSEEIDEQAELKRQSMDIGDFLGNDIYSALEKRKAKRQSIIRQEAMNKAISEREDAMNENNRNSTDVVV